MLATITPANTHLDETLATLRYACQARSIVNRAHVNENPHDRLIRELRAEVERLRALRKDYERNSISSIVHIDDSMNHTDELEELREKLSQTESQLMQAQLSWEQRFMETKQNQLEELAAAEKRKEELESHVRVLETVDMNVALSPIRTNFLEAVDIVLSSGSLNENLNIDVPHMKNLCHKANLNLNFKVNNDNTVNITDNSTDKFATCPIEKLENIRNCNDILTFYNKLIWLDKKKSPCKKLSKSEVMLSMNQIYKALSALKPALEEEDHLRLIFAKVNKSVQSLETALLNSVSKSAAQKTVTFKF